MRHTHNGYFKASVEPDGTLELDVYDQIGETWDGSGITVQNVKDQMDSSKYSKILVRINSNGGDAFQGIAIHNLIRSRKVPVQVCIDGVAASAASIIAMAGDEIEMGANSMMMIHNALALGVGNASDLRKLADVLDKVSESIATTYVNRTGQSLEQVQALMNEETWMSAKDCVANGFANTIADQSNDKAIAMAKTFNYKQFKNQPFTNDTDTEEQVGCMCNCKNCGGDVKNCSDCGNESCIDSNCVNCPFQNDEMEDSNLSQFEARLSLLGRSTSAA